MLRFKILASTVPLALAAFLARADLVPGTHPCIAIGETSLQITRLPWQAQSRVSFTDNSALATVRVQIVDNADAADFAVIDDTDVADVDSCAVTAATRFIGISNAASGSEPVIYLSDKGAGDYRIFVNSRHFTVRDAAALIVTARTAGHARIAAASL